MVKVRQVLLRRLQAVYRYLPLVERFCADDVEYVHQLRVQCRRAEAALAVFRDWLPAKQREKWRARLRQYRRAATRARELDVLGETWDRAWRTSARGRSAGQATSRGRHDGISDDIRAALRQALDRERQLAQEKLVRAVRKVSPARYQRELALLLDRIRWRGPGAEPEWRKVSERILRTLMKRFACAAEKAFRQTSESDTAHAYAKLHRLRITGKKLRYAVEIMHRADGWLPPAEVLDTLKLIQEKLGAINDRVSAAGVISRLRRSAKKEAIREMLQAKAGEQMRSADRLARAFSRWWQKRVTLFHEE